VRSAFLIACILCVLQVGVVRSQDGNGYVGIYGDSLGTQSCVSILPQTAKTLYVVAKSAGPSASGITGLEFRIEVTNPSGWWISFNAASGLVVGNPVDSNPNLDGSGVNISFSTCRLPINGRVVLGTLTLFNQNGGPTGLVVREHNMPRNAAYQCPLFVLCDGPVYSKSCMTPASGDSCAVGVSKALDDATIAFRASVNEPFATIEPIWTIQMDYSAPGAPIAEVLLNRFPEHPSLSFPLRVLRSGRFVREETDTSLYYGMDLYPIEFGTNGVVLSTTTVGVPGNLVTGGFEVPLSALNVPEAVGRLSETSVRVVPVDFLGPAASARSTSVVSSPNGEVHVVRTADQTFISSEHSSYRSYEHVLQQIRFADDLSLLVGTAATSKDSLGIFAFDYSGNLKLQKAYLGTIYDCTELEFTSEGRAATFTLDGPAGTSRYLLDIDSGNAEEIPLLPHSGQMRVLSEDRSTLLTYGEDRLSLYDYSNASTPEHLWTRDAGGHISHAALNADGTLVAYRHGQPGNQDSNDLMILNRDGYSVAGVAHNVADDLVDGVFFVGREYLGEGWRREFMVVPFQLRKLHIYHIALVGG